MRNRSEEAGAVRVRPLRSIIPSLALLFVVALAGSVLKVPTVAAVGNGSAQMLRVTVMDAAGNLVPGAMVAAIIEVAQPVPPGQDGPVGADLGTQPPGNVPAAGGVCPGDGDCCVNNGTPGCDDPECCEIVCAIDPFCCDESWDDICAGEAADLCGDLCGGDPFECGDPASGDCCEANGTPGCDDPECCEIVCAINPFCCEKEWDFICAGEAEDLCILCFVPPPANDNCEDATALSIPSVTDGTTEEATFDAAPFCGTSNTAPGVWYSVTGTGTTITASTCNAANYDTKISVYCGSCDSLTCVTGLDDTAGCGLTTELSWCSQVGAVYLILIHGFSSGTGNFMLTMTEDGVECVADVLCVPTGACCQCDAAGQFCTVESEEDCAALGGEYLGDGAACEAGGDTVTFSSDPNVAIPDNDPSGVNDDINVGESFTILDLEVQVEIIHTWIGDLCVSLSKDGGASELLMSRLDADTGGNLCHSGRPFGCSEINLNVLLDDDAGASIENQCTAGLSGTFRPDPGSLAGFIGGDSAGTYTLNVVDNAAFDLGTFASWSIIFTPPADGDSRCATAFPDQCAVVPALIDIKPGACPNSFNRNSNDVLPVAVVGTADLDVNTIDVASVHISRADGVGGSVPPRSSVLADDATPFVDGEPCECHKFGGDGLDDRVMNFSINELVAALKLNGLPNGAVVELVVTGFLLDGTPFAGTPFEGSDCIQLVDCPADLDNSGAVDVKDLLSLLGAWGPNKGHPADFDNSGAVDVKDLLFLLGAWGPCP